MRRRLWRTWRPHELHQTYYTYLNLTPGHCPKAARLRLRHVHICTDPIILDDRIPHKWRLLTSSKTRIVYIMQNRANTFRTEATCIIIPNSHRPGGLNPHIYHHYIAIYSFLASPADTRARQGREVTLCPPNWRSMDPFRTLNLHSLGMQLMLYAFMRPFYRIFESYLFLWTELDGPYFLTAF